LSCADSRMSRLLDHTKKGIIADLVAWACR
jgi:hypothetical protein